jgi:hypothetical protein
VDPARTHEESSELSGGRSAVATHTHRNGGGGPRNITYYIPPLQLHLLLAGATVTVALGAFAVTIRRWRVLRAPVPLPGASEGSRELPEYRLRPDLRSLEPAAPPADPRPGIAPIPQLFPARLWLWATIFGLATAAAGLWFTGDWKLTGGVQSERPLRLISAPLENRAALDQNGRLFAHVVFGVSIVVLLLLGATLTRTAPRHRGLTVIFMLLGVLAIAGQIWMGVLLLFDSEIGPMTRFN